MKKIIPLLFILSGIFAKAQIPDHIYNANIHSVKLFKAGDIYSYPIMLLNSSDQLELHFDDLDADNKNYYYTYQLCNADWSPCNLQPYDYIRGFMTTRLSTYRYSSLSYIRYTHYQANIPDRNCVPTRSGNYLLKVFINNDTTRLAFTKRFLITDTKAVIAAQTLQPFNAELYKTHQRVQVGVSPVQQVTPFSPSDIKVVILQNNIWPTALFNDRPTIYRGNYYEYSDESTTTFEAGKEWRWIDLRSLRLMSDRMLRMTDSNKITHVFVKPDGDRQQQIYVYYKDLDGIYTIESTDNSNPYWQSDYAYVHFTFVPPGNRAFEGKSIYIFGELTNYMPDENSKMIFNEETGVYEKTLLLKEGYYNYSYITMTDRKDAQNISYENTEGNYYGTENNYTVLVYYHSFSSRADELIGYSVINSYIGH